MRHPRFTSTESFPSQYLQSNSTQLSTIFVGRTLDFEICCESRSVLVHVGAELSLHGIGLGNNKSNPKNPPFPPGAVYIIASQCSLKKNGLNAHLHVPMCACCEHVKGYKKLI